MFSNTYYMNNKTSLLLFLLIIITMVSACRKAEPKENENKASKSAAVVKASAGEKYSVDKKETVVIWRNSMAFSTNGHWGYIYPSKGELMIEKGQLLGGTVEIDMNTIEDEKHGRDNGLVEHLKSADFFEVEKFPTAAFDITWVSPAIGSSMNVTGNLTIKGITHSISIPIMLIMTKEMVTATGHVTIDRTLWDVRYKSGKFFSNLANETISDDIQFEVKIVMRKE